MSGNALDKKRCISSIN